MTFDLAVDENFDVFISHRGDLATVEGRDRFEQEIAFRLNKELVGLIGTLDKSTVRDLARVNARRVAQKADRIDRIAAMRTEFSKDQPNTLILTIIYDTGDEATFEVTG